MVPPKVSPLPKEPVTLKMKGFTLVIQPVVVQALQTVIGDYLADQGRLYSYDSKGLLVVGPKICDPKKDAKAEQGLRRGRRAARLTVPQTRSAGPGSSLAAGGPDAAPRRTPRWRGRSGAARPSTQLRSGSGGRRMPDRNSVTSCSSVRPPRRAPRSAAPRRSACTAGRGVVSRGAATRPPGGWCARRPHRSSPPGARGGSRGTCPGDSAATQAVRVLDPARSLRSPRCTTSSSGHEEQQHRRVARAGRAHVRAEQTTTSSSPAPDRLAGPRDAAVSRFPERVSPPAPPGPR